MYGIKANVKAPHKFLRMGAKVVIMFLNYGGGGDKVRVYGMSRGGRMVETFVDARDLRDYRAAWIEPCTVGGLPFHGFADRSKVQAEAETMQRLYGSQPVRPHAEQFGHAEASQ